MNYDISALLQKWVYQPGQVAARRFKGKDGREKLQLRVDLGLLQMNVEGRPDGKRPMGFDSWFDFYRARWEKANAAAEAPEENRFRLSNEDCTRLQQEAIQYHHRYICFFQLGDFDAVERDSDRNLEVFGFVRAFAVTDELSWAINQFAPQLFLMRTRAVATRSLKAKRHAEAVRNIEEGIHALEEFYREFEREDLLDNSQEILSLRQWLEDVRVRKPLTELEKLQRALAEAIRTEDYERAAKVRDQLKKLRVLQAMSLQSQINDQLKAAMLARNTERTNALRLIKSALTYAQIGRDAGELTDEETTIVLRKEAKKRQDSISEFEAAGRTAQAAQEQSELAIITEFLPKALSPEEVEAIVKAAIAETGATTKKDMGAVMKAATAKAGGRADGKTLSGVVMRLLP